MSNFSTSRPPIMGVTHMVCAGHYLAAAAGYRILEEGGNAVDAGVAAGIAINVVLPENTNFAGVAPIMVYLAESSSVVTISGLGRWPKTANIDYFQRFCNGEIPTGIRRAVVPAAPDAWLSALSLYGTLPLEAVLTPALELAREGYPLSAVVRDEMIESESSSDWPANQAVFRPTGSVPGLGERLVQDDLANTFQRLIDVERAHLHLGREQAIRAARDEFYRGDIAREMIRFSESQDGLLSYNDLAGFEVGHEAPVTGSYRDTTIYSCGPWCQGPVVPQALQMLEDDDLAALGHNSPDYVHLTAQTLDLCFADRDRFYGDPGFVDVPMERLLDPSYTRARRASIEMDRAFTEMPLHGLTDLGLRETRARAGSNEPGAHDIDTSYTCVVDRWGNAFSATPSDSNLRNPLVPGLGFSLSGRGTQSWLEPDHASCVAPGKRPRLTPNPAMVLRGDQLLMPFGCPGGDAQCQAMVQTFLNIVAFGMNPQEAIEQPRFCTWNFPNSFWPHEYLPGSLHLEGRFSSETAKVLAQKGRDVKRVGAWEAMDMGVMSAITIDPASGVLSGGADPRRETYAIGR